MGARRQITFFDEPVNGGRLVADRRAQGRRLHRATRAATRTTSSSTSTRRSRTRCGSPTAGPRGHGRLVAGRHAVRVPVDGADRRRHRRLHRRSARPHARRRWCSRRPRSGWNVGRLVAGRQVAAAHPLRLGQRELPLGLRPRDAREARDRAGEGEGRPRRRSSRATARACTSRRTSAASSGRCATSISRAARSRRSPIT